MDKLQTHTQSHTLEGFTPVISGTGPGTGTGAPHPTLHIRESDRHSRVIGECCTSRLSHRWVWRSDKRYAGIYTVLICIKRCHLPNQRAGCGAVPLCPVRSGRGRGPRVGEVYLHMG